MDAEAELRTLRARYDNFRRDFKLRLEATAELLKRAEREERKVCSMAHMLLTKMLVEAMTQCCMLCVEESSRLVLVTNPPPCALFSLAHVLGSLSKARRQGELL